PDLTLAMSAEHVVKANIAEETADFTLPTNTTDTKWIKAVDLMPGASSMVRDAVVSIDNGPVLAAWVPGSDVIPAPSGAAFKLPAGAAVHLRMHYKKSWKEEQNDIADKST